MRTSLAALAVVVLSSPGCGGSEGESQVNRDPECRDLGSISKPLALNDPRNDPIHGISAFTTPRIKSDRVPRAVRFKLNESATVGSFLVEYSRSRRITTRLAGQRVTAYLAPTSEGGLCYGFDIDALPADCVVDLVRRTGTWIVSANRCLPMNSSFVGVVHDAVTALEIRLQQRSVTIRVVNNIATWRAGAALKRAQDVRRVIAVLRDGRRIDLS